MADITALHLDKLYYPVGELIINWSVFDHQLVLIVAILYQNDTGRSLERQLPREFSRRIRFLRKCITRFPQLSQYADGMRNMLDAAKEVSIVRDALVHGAVSSYDKKDQCYSLKKLDIAKTDDMHEAKTIRMTLEDVQEYVIQSQSLMSFAIQISDHLANALPS